MRANIWAGAGLAGMLLGVSMVPACGEDAPASPPGAVSGTTGGGGQAGGSGDGGAGGGGTGAAGGAGCVPRVPAIEVCDGADDDCDGAIDEDFPDGCDDPKADTDGDELRDDWEVHGVDVDGDGVVDVDLPAMGADPLRKDAFVHVDWMEDTGPSAHSDRFSDDAMWRVQQAYLDAPVDNPDGSQGISLHIDAGPESVMNPLTMATWGSLGKGAAIPHQDQIDTSPADGGELVSLQTAHMPIERRGLFRYGVAVHSLAPQVNSADCPDLTIQFNGKGIGDAFVYGQGSSDWKLIELGGFDPNVQDSVQEGGLFMHELGHTFGLKHGGTSHVHRKPNYLSVMNYSYTYRGLWRDGQYGLLDYSRFSLPTLDENALDEAAGLGAPLELATYGFIRYCGNIDLTCVPDLASFQGQLLEEPDATAAIDWDCSGAVDASPVKAEIHLTPPREKLPSANDWKTLDFSATGLIGGTAGALASASGVDSAPMTAEPTRDDPADRLRKLPFRVVASGQGILEGRPGPGELAFVVLNRGARPDTYVLHLRAKGLTLRDPAERTLELAPGAHAIIPVAVELSEARAERASLRLSVVSRGNPRMSAEATTLVR